MTIEATRSLPRVANTPDTNEDLKRTLVERRRATQGTNPNLNQTPDRDRVSLSSLANSNNGPVPPASPGVRELELSTSGVATPVPSYDQIGPAPLPVEGGVPTNPQGNSVGSEALNLGLRSFATNGNAERFAQLFENAGFKFTA